MQHGLDSHLDQVESRKERLKIADYSITQASLEHVIGPSFRWCKVDIFNARGILGLAFDLDQVNICRVYSSYLSLAFRKGFNHGFSFFAPS